MIIRYINMAIAVLFLICYAYQFFYIFVSLIKKPKQFIAKKKHRFAVLVSAMNEEKVIGNLIESIKKQKYPSELLDVFVIADNCTDSTAELAKKAGAFVYERNNLEKRGKGYAIDFLFDHLKEDGLYERYDGFFIFDADNLLDGNYVSEMNKVFDNGYKVITSYRSSKNYGTNWISAGYSLWFMREARYLNHPRMELNTSCAVSGTGFLIHRDVIDRIGGWKFFLLTEDIEFSWDCVFNDEKIGYCHSAIFYDEQPTTLKQSWHQRIRWSKGYYQVFGKYGKQIIKNFFSERFFTCFDMTMIILPSIFISCIGIVANVTAIIVSVLMGNPIIPLLLGALKLIVGAYILLIIMAGIFTTITEWNKINCSAFKKILYLLTFPLFMFTYIPITIAAMFKKVEWKHIDHDIAVTIEDFNKK